MDGPAIDIPRPRPHGFHLEFTSVDDLAAFLGLFLRADSNEQLAALTARLKQSTTALAGAVKAATQP